MQKITPFLWFDKEARESATLYISLFEDSKIKDTIIMHGTPSGTVEILSIELAGLEIGLMQDQPSNSPQLYLLPSHATQRKKYKPCGTSYPKAGWP